MNNFAIVILAAGNASRLGRPKQLLDFGGEPLVRRAVRQAADSGCRPIVVVAGAYQAEVESALAGTEATVVENPRWAEGMGTSIQAGLAALPADCPGVILTLADQPLLTGDTYRRLLTTHNETGRPIAAASYAGTAGVPVLFTSEYFPHLQRLSPGQGCKGVILAHPHAAALVPCPEAEADIDTEADYARLIERTLTAV